MSSHSDAQAILAHYDTETGIGNVYKLLAGWSNAIRAILFGWENAPLHPAVLRYAFDYTGGDFETALKKPVYELFDLLHLKKGKVLDAGCGVGGATLLLGQRYPDMHFTGVSLSPGQIATAKKRATKKALINVTYKVANYLHLPFEDASFDGILASETLCHVKDSDKPQLFKEFHRVLNKGGRVAIFDAYLNDRPLKEMRMPELHTQVFRGWMLPDPISTLSYFTNTAKKYGFKVVEKADITERILGCSQEVVRRYELFKGLIPLVKSASSLRKRGIKLPILSQMGFDQPEVIAFGQTALLQYDMFNSRDAVYYQIVLQKS